MSDHYETDSEALNPKPGVWTVAGKDYRIKPPKLRHVGTVIKLQRAFSPFQRLSGKETEVDATEAMLEMTDDEIERMKGADKEFEEMMLELVEGITPEELDDIGMMERLSGFEIIVDMLGSADQKALKKIGAKPVKKGASPQDSRES